MFFLTSVVPELNGKSDDQRRRLIRQAIFRRGDALWFIPALAGAAVCTVWAGIGIGIVRLVLSYAAAKNLAAGGAGPVTLPKPLMPSLVMAGLVLFTVAAVLVRRVMLIRSLRYLVTKAACPFCHFSLVGLKPVSEAGTGLKPVIRCPECGELVSLFDHGILPQDLLTEHDHRRPFDGAGPMGSYSTDPEYYRKRMKATLAGRGKVQAETRKR